MGLKQTQKLLSRKSGEGNGTKREFSCTSGVKGHTKMAPSKKKHAKNQASVIPGGFTGISNYYAVFSVPLCPRR